ncbi:serine hydrolase [Variovorax guangxiensis]|nr:serine hydrolase [Variovorax guangxiensis]
MTEMIFAFRRRSFPNPGPASTSLRRWASLAHLALAVGFGGAASAETDARYAHEQSRDNAPALAATADDRWADHLLADLARIDASGKARIGVYVRDLDTGRAISYKADQRWYLASMVKVPVAMAVLRGIERGDYTLDTEVTLRASDYVDGAGSTNRQPVGQPIAIRVLLEQMIIYSDNTASDMLIDLVGIAEVNALVASLVPEGFRRITSLGAIRRTLYGSIAPGAEQLAGQDLLLLHRERSDAARLKLLSRMVDVPASRFRLPSLDAAYNAYYATGLNSGRLDAYGELMSLLVGGKALSPLSTSYLLKLMERVATGTNRIKAGLPTGVRFAHKTGTQRRRTCDAGLVRTNEANGQRRVLVVACTRDEPSLERSEFALMQVGAAICRSGLLTQGMPDETLCHAAPALRIDRQPVSPRR